MASDKALSQSRGAARSLLAGCADAAFFRPLKAVWWLFTNVRFAILLLALVSLIGLLGVLVPQVPSNVRGDVLAEAAWLDFQHGKFGPLTGPMDRVALFDIFHARWFTVLLAITVVSTGSYVLSRAPGIWRTITRPRTRVPDRYFQVAPQRVELTEALDPERFEKALRRGRYRVERTQEGEATYFFADRFSWAALGTLLTHASIILFIVAAAYSKANSYEAPLFLGEGSTLPVFPVRDANQMQVQLVAAHASFTPEGRPLDYRSQLVIFDRGERVKECVSTVNSPCAYNGYRFHQVGYFGFGAAVEVKDRTSGDVIYRETLPLRYTMPSPKVRIRDAGSGMILLEDSMLFTTGLTATDFTYYGTVADLPDGRRLTIGVQRPSSGEDWALVVLEPDSGSDARLVLNEGDSGVTAGLEVSYVEAGAAPAIVVDDFPALTPDGRGSTQILLQMSNAIYGTGSTSAGTNLPVPPVSGPPRLAVTGLPQPLTLEPGQTVVVGDYEYSFLGQRQFAQINAKRDRSDYLVWIGASMILLGLMLTFWVPRRRLWAKIGQDSTFIAGQASARANFTRELRRLARSAGAKLPPDPEYE